MMERGLSCSGTVHAWNNACIVNFSCGSNFPMHVRTYNFYLNSFTYPLYSMHQPVSWMTVNLSKEMDDGGVCPALAQSMLGITHAL